MFDKEQIIPIGMVFCGRPSNETTAIDFVIDPWKTTRVGYSDKPSTAIMFGCGDKYYIEVYSKTGAYDVQTDEALASDGKTRPKGVSISVSGTSFRARSATDKPIDLGIRYRLVADSLIDNRLIENTASH